MSYFSGIGDISKLREIKDKSPVEQLLEFLWECRKSVCGCQVNCRFFMLQSCIHGFSSWLKITVLLWDFFDWMKSKNFFSNSHFIRVNSNWQQQMLALMLVVLIVLILIFSEMFSWRVFTKDLSSNYFVDEFIFHFNVYLCLFDIFSFARNRSSLDEAIICSLTTSTPDFFFKKSVMLHTSWLNDIKNTFVINIS